MACWCIFVGVVVTPISFPSDDGRSKYVCYMVANLRIDFVIVWRIPIQRNTSINKKHINITMHACDFRVC